MRIGRGRFTPAPTGGTTSTPSAKIGAATGRFHTEGRHIVDPDGYEFIPRGLNVGGTVANNGSGWPDFTLEPAYINGQAAAGCNAARIVMFNTSRNVNSIWGKKYGGKLYAADTATRPARDAAIDAQAIAEIDALADKITRAYRAAGIVVVMECHDLTDSAGIYSAPGVLGPDGLTWIAEVQDFWRRYAARWKDDSGVWFNFANEPNLKQPEWIAFHDKCMDVVRNEVGASNICATDAIYYASDLGKYGSSSAAETFARGYDPAMVPALITKYAGNVILSCHNYGSHGIFTTTANVTSYMQKYRDANIPLMFGEVGFIYDGVSANNGSWANEHDGAVTTLAVAPDYGIGVFWWASAFGDGYRLYDPKKNSSGGLIVENEFASTTVLNEAGRAFFAYLDKIKAVDPVKG